MSRRTLFLPAMLLAAAGMLSFAEGAHAEEGAIAGLLEGLGLAPPPPAPAPFVLQSRPQGDLPWIDVFTPPAEPKAPALKPDQVKALRAELLGADKRQDALRLAAPPSPKPKARTKPPADAGAPTPSP